jgi:hypothetical protein
MCHGLDIQYRSHLFRAQFANEYEKEDNCGHNTRFLRYVSIGRLQGVPCIVC